jgi:hypothetical protein
MHRAVHTDAWSVDAFIRRSIGGYTAKNKLQGNVSPLQFLSIVRAIPWVPATGHQQSVVAIGILLQMQQMRINSGRPLGTTVLWTPANIPSRRSD